MINHQAHIQAVDTANITRSPVWEAVAADYAGKQGRDDIIVSSSGMRAANNTAEKISLPGKEFVLQKYAGFIQEAKSKSEFFDSPAYEARMFENIVVDNALRIIQEGREPSNLDGLVNRALSTMGLVVTHERSAWLKQNGLYLPNPVGQQTQGNGGVHLYVVFGERNERELVDLLFKNGIVDADDYRGPEIKTIDIADAWGRADPQAFQDTYEAVRQSATEIMREYLSR